MNGGRAVGMTLALVVALVAVAALAGPGTAAASRTIRTGVADPLSSIGAGDQPLWVNRMVNENLSFVRINLPWAVVAPSQPSNAGDPGDPAYHFAAIDTQVENVEARGLQPVFTLYDAPRWAEGPGISHETQPSTGSWKPSPAKFGAFAHAVAARYSGTFSPGLLEPVLPRVSYFEIWNEPNLSVYLQPQWVHGKPASPKSYALLLNAAYAQIKSVNASNQVIGGVTAPRGVATRHGPRMQPLTFLSNLFCAPHSLTCAPKPHLDIVSHHPIERSEPPTSRAGTHNDIQCPDMHRLKSLVRQAVRRGHLAGNKHPQIWATEVWWETNPPDKKFGLSPLTQARYMEQALYLFWKQGVSVAFNFLLRDEKYKPPAHGKDQTLQTGTYFFSGKRKPSATAIRFPFVVDRTSKSRARAWGIPPATGTVVIEKKSGGGWKPLKSLSANYGRVFAPKIHVRGKATLRARYGTESSLPWKLSG